MKKEKRRVRQEIKKDRESSLEQHSEHSDDISRLHRESPRLRAKYTGNHRDCALMESGKSVAKSESKSMQKITG